MFSKPLTCSYSIKIIRQYTEVNGEYEIELLRQFKIGGGGKKTRLEKKDESG